MRGLRVNKIIAGNWKMYKTIPEARELAGAIVRGAGAIGSHVEALVCPPFIALDAVAGCLEGSPVKLGAQNMYYQDNGAFTGECSGSMLIAARCEYVILGHSERRHVFGEMDTVINLKMHAAIQCGLKPILCVGETEQERDLELTRNVLERHIRYGMAGIKNEAIDRCIIAYEPVWAIGTGRTASPGQVHDAHLYIHRLLQNLFSEKGREIPVLYGGSVKPQNAEELLNQPGVDGALVGGASLQAESFLDLIRIAAEKNRNDQF
jgi:triosephosphate isomerase (TIM)